ncbi:hypothetical protein ACFL35_12410 [Candidatus Riflebacteria bacterium]
MKNKNIILITLIFSFFSFSLFGGNFPEKRDCLVLEKLHTLAKLEIDSPYAPQARHIDNINSLPIPVFLRRLGRYPQNSDEIGVWNRLKGNLLQISSSAYPNDTAYSLLKQYKGKTSLLFKYQHPDSYQVRDLSESSISKITFAWNNLPDLYVFKKLEALRPFHLKWSGQVPGLYDAKMLTKLPLKSLTFDNNRYLDSGQVWNLNAIEVPFHFYHVRIPDSSQLSYLERLKNMSKFSIRAWRFPSEDEAEDIAELAKLHNFIRRGTRPYPANSDDVKKIANLRLTGSLIFEALKYPFASHIEHLNKIQKPYIIKIYYKPGQKPRVLTKEYIAGLDLNDTGLVDELLPVIKNSPRNTRKLLQQCLQFHMLHQNPMLKIKMERKLLPLLRELR